MLNPRELSAPVTGSELPADHMALHHGSPRPGLSTALWERRRGSHGGTAPPSTELPVSTAWRGLWVLLVHLGMPPRVTVTPPPKQRTAGAETVSWLRGGSGRALRGVAWPCTRGDSAATGPGRAPCSPRSWARPTAPTPDLGDARRTAVPPGVRLLSPDAQGLRSLHISVRRLAVRVGPRYRPPPPETAVLTASQPHS